ncbi:mechanosensitive ion channel family protein [Rhizobium sp. TRM95796]|uniref:mechanosensitive ion channel family protein n=1 Tax=Rhizobium sp. TRM95796 TaxID=2979862 RepID=UPI0021E824C0|nr:mechanosensitive ion channel domain-containing protein [Rhizobium sp. TRM95796]MCV3764463.1 mechanosensitive ion channel [Rhizobium sp. TRM95796]
MKRLPFLSLFLAAALTAAYGGAALAQTAPQPAATSQPPAEAPSTQRTVVKTAVDTLRDEVQASVNKAAGDLEALRGKATRSSDDDSALSLLKLEADVLAEDIAGSTADLEARYEVVTKRLEELGPAPTDGKAEDKAVTDDRKRLQDEKASMSSLLSDVDALKTEVARVSADITERRRTLFTDTLFRRLPISSDLLSEASAAATTLSGQMLSATTNSLEFMWNFKRGGFLGAIFGALLAAILFMLPLKRKLAPLAHRDPDVLDPPYFRRVSAGFLSLIVPAAATAAFVLTCLVILYNLKVLREDLYAIFASSLWAIVGVYFIWRLSRAIFSPLKPQWRLVDLTDRGARWLVTIGMMLAVINALSSVLTQTFTQFGAPVSLSIVKGIASALLIGGTLIVASFIKPRLPLEDGGPSRAWPIYVRILLLATGVGLIVTALSGYIGLAQFVSSQVIVTSTIMVTMYIGFSAAHAISESGAFAQTNMGAAIARRHNLDEIRIDQVGLVVGLVGYGLVVLVGVPLILSQWGFRAADILGMFVELFTEIHIGNISISLLGIFAGVVVFFAGLFGARWFQRWLDGNVLARSQIDVGARNSVNTALGYAGVVIAAVIGISAAGIDLSSLALIASALSLGIGFGLQTIVQNFVSGLILLAERPFRVGDWIVNGNVEGFVRRISVRATEIETFRNQSVIVPNSQLINAAVGNWTLRNKLARSEIPIGVAYGSDPRKVMDILLEIARSQPLVLTMPEPHVEFVGFGESALNFELRFYLADLFTGMGVRNAIRIEILERFEEEGIEIPYPQRVLTVRQGQGVTNAMMAEALRGEGMTDDEAQALARARDGVRKRAEDAARDIDQVAGARHSHHNHRDDDDEDGDDDGR